MQNSILSALPYFVQWVVAISCSWYADYLRENNIASTRTVRKIFNTIGTGIRICIFIYLSRLF